MNGDLAIREGAWKLIAFRDGRRALYNLESDLSETKDVIDQHPDVAKRLEGSLTETLGSISQPVRKAKPQTKQKQKSPQQTPQPQ